MQKASAAISPTIRDSEGGFEHRKSGFWTPVTASYWIPTRFGVIPPTLLSLYAPAAQPTLQN